MANSNPVKLGKPGTPKRNKTDPAVVLSIEEFFKKFDGVLMAIRDEIKFLHQRIDKAFVPIREINLLTGELRMVRQLLDKNGRFIIVDRQREIEDAQAAAEVAAQKAAPKDGKENP